MRRQAISAALLVVGIGVVLGATVFRADIAQATGLAQSVTVNNTTTNPVPVREQNLDGGNIKVHEQGTANVKVMNLPAVQATRDLNSPGQKPGLGVWSNKAPGAFQVSPDIPSGEIFIATHFSTRATSTSLSLTGASCALMLGPSGGGGGVFFIELPGDLISGASWSASAQMFVPVESGQEITAFCDATGSGPLNTFFEGILSGYFVPAS